MLRTLRAVAITATALAAFAAHAQVDTRLFDGMEWRNIGPFRGGRSQAVSGVIGDRNVYYMGSTGGGLWKTTDGGDNWDNVSDGFFQTGSVGAVATAPTNGDIVYVGMGETEIRGNISHGDGVYKSTDAGKTWKNIGLRETLHISRVRIHPENPDVVWVAALGAVYGFTEERGIYKTTNGGETWRRVLFESDKAGAVDLCLDPGNPDVMYASTWEAWRTPYSLNSGGPGSKMWKSTDGGETWKDISRNPGLPEGTLGKIGVAVSPSNPNRVYAQVENLNGGLFRSEDAGETWKLINDARNMRQRAWYYSRVYVDPNDEDTVFVLNVGFHKSTNGGERFTSLRSPHSDQHDLWIDPADSTRMINANDGGGNVSTDGGRTWTAQDYATAQMYHVSVDNSHPYYVLGAQQDNSTVRIPSRTGGFGIGRDDWTSTAGGESGYVSAKPDEPWIVFGGSYGGLLTMRNHRTGLSRNVNAWPDNPMGHGAIDSRHRIQWTFPIVFSHHNPNILYTCSQHVLKSTDLGASWQEISPDLSRNDPSTLGPSGGPITKDNTGVEYYGTVFTLSESPLRAGVLWAGSDDGRIHITENEGGSWREITPAGMPKWGLASIIDASPHDVGTAWLAVDNHENNDFKPYLYVTRNKGVSWTKITNGIPEDEFVRVIREDPVVKDLVYAGTEKSVYVSHNGGRNWQPLALNLPVVPVHDLVVKDSDLVIGTHGRSFWILDDIAPIRQAAGKSASNAVLFAPSDASRARWGGGGFGRRGGGDDDEPLGPNPPTGVLVNYYLPSEADEVTVTIKDREGNELATRSGSTDAGFSRVALRPTYPSFQRPQGMILWAAGPRPIVAPPGTYIAQLTVDGKEMSESFQWTKDPRSPATDADLVAQFNLARQISASVDEANNAVYRIRELRGAINDRIEARPALAQGGERLIASLVEVEEAIYQTKNQSGQDPLNYPIRLNNKIAALLGVVLSGEFGPTKQSYDVYEMLSAELDKELAKLSALENGAVQAFSRRAAAAGLDPLPGTGS